MRVRNIIDHRIISKFGDEVVGQSGDELIYCCPFCEENGKTPDVKGNLYVNNKNLKYFCQRCQAKGSLKFHSTKGYHFDNNPAPSEFTEILESILLKNSNEIEFDYEIPNLRPVPNTEAYNYLIRRGISPEMMEFYDIRVGSILSKYKHRIIIPNQVIVDDDGKHWTDMFVARYIREIPKDAQGKDMIPRYLNPFGDNRRKCVFNLHRIPKGTPIIITEGSLTAISAGSNAIATYGKYVTDTQLKMILSNQPSSIYVNLDPDAYEGAVALCDKLLSITSIPIYLVVLPEDKDANDLGHENYMKYIINAKPYTKSSEIIFNMLK